jgi:hypothetical protein
LPAEFRDREQIGQAVDSIKLDLVVFGSDGGILQRLLTEMGPVRSLKTIVRAFVIDVE